jgi:hypothetical protein
MVNSEKRKVVIRLMGGFGNQLHQLSLALYLRDVIGYKVVIDDYSGYVSDDFGRESMLDEVNDILNLNKIHNFYFRNYFIKIFKFLSFFLNITIFNWKYKVENINQSLNCLVGNMSDKELHNIFLEGYWLQNSFNFKMNLVSLYNFKKQGVFQSLNSMVLVIHFRADRFSEILPFDYFMKMVKKHLDITQISSILIFSDSEKVFQLKDHLIQRIPSCPTVDVDLFDYKPTILLELILTYKYFIPSLGTFSYWASAFGSERVVYLPIEFAEVINLSTSNKYIL